jgi:dinuclear metal center YbgI/SA1388 family protein
MLTSSLVSHLDTFLEITRYEDRSNNGLQVQGAAHVERIAFAVDACAASIEAAARAGAQMLVVHHGLFWSEHLQITGAHHRRLRLLLDAGLNLYAAHIPLDAHPQVGNNIQLARMAGLVDVAPWGRHRKDTIGFIGDLPQPTDVQLLRRRIEEHIGRAALVQGDGDVRRVAVCSGFGVPLMYEAIAAGADALLTGETSHQWFHAVAEQPLKVVYGGHYNTETVGLKALAQHLVEECALETLFVNLPTGL